MQAVAAHLEHLDRARAQLQEGLDRQVAAAGIAVPRPGTIEISTLGRFEVGGASGEVRWPSRKALLLLQVLATRAGQAVHRDLLAEQFWPGGEPTRQRRRLAVVLSDLRRALDPGRRYEIGHYVSTRQGSLTLHEEHVVVDVDRFRADARAGLAAWRAADAAAAGHHLRRAADRYRGPFLPGALYDDWAVGPREDLRRTQGDVLRALVDTCTGSGDGAGARQAAESLTALDPYDEQAHRLLVEILEGAGRHGEAAKATERYHARMREIGVRPPSGDG